MIPLYRSHEHRERTMIHTIYLDMDDVLVELVPGVLRWFGVGSNYADYPLRSRNTEKALNTLAGREVAKGDLWHRFGTDFWANLSKTPQANWLISACKRLVGPGNVFLASYPISAASAAGKIEWIRRHLPKWLHEQYVLTPRKWMLAQPGALLIDDTPAFCRRWMERGGEATLFPRPWNEARGRNPREYVTRMLEHYFE